MHRLQVDHEKTMGPETGNAADVTLLLGRRVKGETIPFLGVRASYCSPHWVCVCVVSVKSDSPTPWTVATGRAPSVRGFSWQESWRGCHFSPSGTFPTQGEPTCPVSPALQAGSVPTEPRGKPHVQCGQEPRCGKGWAQCRCVPAGRLSPVRCVPPLSFPPPPFILPFSSRLSFLLFLNKVEGQLGRFWGSERDDLPFALWGQSRSETGSWTWRETEPFGGNNMCIRPRAPMLTSGFRFRKPLPGKDEMVCQ